MSTYYYFHCWNDLLEELDNSPLPFQVGPIPETKCHLQPSTAFLEVFQAKKITNRYQFMASLQKSNISCVILTDMYDLVPTNEFAKESISCPDTPKSHSLISPLELTNTLEGLTSL